MEVEINKKWNLTYSFCKKCDCASTLIWFWSSELQNWESINVFLIKKIFFTEV